MNQFEHGLRIARARQHAVYAGLAGAVVLVCLIVAGFIGYSSGTSIEIGPAEAHETGSVELVSGAGLAAGGVVYALAGEPVIRVSAPGFASATRKIAADEKGGTVRVTLAELPGRLRVSTNPPGPKTRWHIDGRPVAIAETLDHVLEPGRYELTIDNPFFRPAERLVEVQRGEEIRLSVDLDPVAGRLAVASVPEGANVAIDGTHAGQTPLDLALAGGTYALRIGADGFLDIEDSIEITNTDPELSRTYRLAPVPATLRFELSPPGGALLVNGTKIDPSLPHMVPANVDARIAYFLDGYFAKTLNVTPAPREEHMVSISLEPEIGTVEILSQPQARIFADNKAVGETPLTIRLPAKQHRISLRREGYRSVDVTVTPSSKHKTSITRTLLTERAARLAEAPDSYTNKAGIELSLFKPAAFTMGAPRSEKGQRANEFLRQVRLTKPFYAAKHEVTNAQFAQFRSGHAAAGGPRDPVASVSWADAAAFCNWLSRNEKLTPFYDLQGGQLRGFNAEADGYRLLSEAEWEWLARRANKQAQTVFSWGDETIVPPKAGNIADESARGVTRFFVPNYTDGFAQVAPVGSFLPEASNLFDITGNVSEWVHDYYSLEPPRPDSVESDPLGPSFGDAHVVKGSSWRSGTRTTLRAAYREGLLGVRDDVGFRVGRYLHGGEDAAAKN